MSQGWGNNQGKPQQGQGWGNQPQQGQGWGNQPQQGQGWGNQQQQQGWGNQPQKPNQGQQGWGNQPNQGFQQNQGFGQQHQGTFGTTSNTSSGLFNPNQDYQIVTALDNDRVLDISQANNASKFQVILWSKNGDKNQRFRFREVGGGKYMIVSGTGAVLEVPNNSSANGTQLLGGQANNASNEYFEIFPSQNVKGGYIIKTFNGKAVDVCEGKDAKGTPIIQWDYNGGKNQSWIIKPI